MSKTRSSVGFLVPFLMMGCSAEDGAWEAGGAAETPEETVSTESSALSKEVWCQVVDTLKTAANIVLDADIDASCNVRTTKELYYFGSSPRGHTSSGMPRRTALGFYCALDASDGAKNEATLSTPVGKFGTRTRYRITKRKTSSHEVNGQLIADTYLFGASFPFSVHDLAWNYSLEDQTPVTAPAQTDSGTRYNQTLPDHRGYYADIVSEGVDFGFAATANFMAGPVPVTVTVSFDNDIRHWGYQNNRFTTSPGTAFSYSALVNDCGTCLTCRPCPTTAERRGHELLCSGGCNSTYFRNLSDDILPYSGPFGGARADYLYQVPNVNSWQIGYPDGSVAYPDEKRYTLAPRNGYDEKHTTKFEVEVIGTYDAGSATLKAGVVVDHRNRNGMAIRENEIFGRSSEASRETQLWTELSAETDIGVNAWLRLSIPLLGTLKRDFKIVDSGKKPSSTNGAKIRWTSDPTGDDNNYNLFMDGTQSLDPADAFSACLDDAKDQSRTRTPNTTGKEFMEEVHEPARKNVYPCNVKICVPTGEGASGGRLTTCTWDTKALDLKCTETGNSCKVPDTKADMCDADGDVLTGTTTCQPCRTNAHCSTNNFCNGSGCCEPVPR